LCVDGQRIMCSPDFTKRAHEPNGMKLTAEPLLY
jgi:hypothetical protein